MIRCPYCQYAVAGKKKLCQKDIDEHIKLNHSDKSTTIREVSE